MLLPNILVKYLHHHPLMYYYAYRYLPPTFLGR